MGEYRKAGGFGGNKRGGFGAGRPSFGGGKSGFGGGVGRPSFHRSGNRDDGPREMFSATCSSCQKSCEIPFRPSGDRPVYCRDCFGSQESPTSDARGRRDERGGESRFPRKEYRTSGASFPKPLMMEDKRMEGLKRQLDDVSVKVDQILHILNSKSVLAPVEVKPSKKKSDIAEVREAVQHIITDIKAAQESAQEEESAIGRKKIVKKKTTPKKA